MRKETCNLQGDPHEAMSRFLSGNISGESEMLYLKYWKKITGKQGYFIQWSCLFMNKGDIKTFPDKQKLREVITTTLALQETLKCKGNS